MMDSEGKFIDHIINEIHRILLGVLAIHFESLDPCCIINGCILKPMDQKPVMIFQIDKFDVYLNPVLS
jgi:hypothetical protein